MISLWNTILKSQHFVNKAGKIRHLTCAHMRIISVFVRSQSRNTLTTWINPWLVIISSFSNRVFSLCTDSVLCWLPSESESKSGELGKMSQKTSLIRTLWTLCDQMTEHHKHWFYVLYKTNVKHYHFHWFHWQYRGSFHRGNLQEEEEEEESLGRGELSCQ